MVGHQHIGVDGAAKFFGELFEVVKVALVVLLRLETDRAIIAALNDVPRNTGERKTSTARHIFVFEVKELAA
jgi:hypothetical protein